MQKTFLIVLTILVASVYSQVNLYGCGEAPLAPVPTVGRREANYEKDERIINGSVAIPNSWPWHGILQENNYFICGASLVDNFWAVTGAHCINGYDIIKYISNYF